VLQFAVGVSELGFIWGTA